MTFSDTLSKRGIEKEKKIELFFFTKLKVLKKIPADPLEFKPPFNTVASF